MKCNFMWFKASEEYLSEETTLQSEFYHLLELLKARADFRRDRAGTA